ncbi:ABC transporter ATP-binding protein [Streptomyces armeniacus]|uniref:ABC transporter ATP-binding protein n=1 Tax=Streptomyces armeniacus TaxID=83291 RepID=UPI001FEC0816|nr:ABC transporter ATP-binding protein [Streptomyces armeniacus]
MHARALAKSYPGGTEAVRGVDLAVRPGETFAFLGPNGAGKSTTISLLCALARPTAGEAHVCGADVRTEPQRVRRTVGLLFQHSALDSNLTARQNLYVHARLYGLSRAAAGARGAELLALAGLDDRQRAPVRTLSGGMRRRLEIARALLHDPRVLFLDEPTVGLDPHARAQIWDHLHALRAERRTTLFLTTHYLEEAEHCDRIAIIDAGRVVAEGPPRELKAEIADDRLRLRTSDDAATAGILRDTFGLSPAVAGDAAVPDEADAGVTVRVGEGATWIPQLCVALAARDIAVHAVSTTPPTLDDVFFHHTGRSIRA